MPQMERNSNRSRTDLDAERSENCDHIIALGVAKFSRN